MHISRALIGSFVAVALLGGCASTGNRVLKSETEQTVASKLQQGVSTKTQVKQLFGDPTTTSFTDGGNEVWKYSFEDVSSDAINYIPVVNWLGASYSGSKKELTILFDKNDIVQRFSMVNSDVKRKSGLYNLGS